MRRGRIFFYLAIILLLGLVAVVLLYQRYIGPTTKTGAKPQATAILDVVNIYIVSQKVPRGGVMTGDVLNYVPIPRDLFIEGMFTDLAQVVGRLAKFDLEPGTILTKGMLVNRAEELSGTGSDLALAIPRGMVAVAIPISVLSNLSYPPQPGDHLNVISTIKLVDVDTDFQTILPNLAGVVIAPGVPPPEGENYLTSRIEGAPSLGKTDTIPGLGAVVYSVPSERQRARMVTQNLLQNVVVLNIDNFNSIISGETEEIQNKTEGVATPEPAAGQEEAVKPPPDFISLIVTPQDALTLNYLVTSGAQVTIVLRAAGDDSRVQTEAVTLQFLMNQYSIPVPVKLPYSLEPRVDLQPAPAE